MATGSLNGKIATLVSWKNCIAAQGLDSVRIELSIQPADNTESAYTVKKPLPPGLPGGEILANNLVVATSVPEVTNVEIP